MNLVALWQALHLTAFWQWLEDSPLGAFVAGSEWAFPTIESIHVIAIVTVVGSIAVMDLRLLGAASRDHAVKLLSRDTLPWTWGAFVIAAISGLLLFSSKAHIYVIDPWFIAKMAAMAIAGINMAIFHATTWKTVDNWNEGSEIPMAGKVAAGLSLFFWIVVIFCGRLIGFTLGLYE